MVVIQLSNEDYKKSVENGELVVPDAAECITNAVVVKLITRKDIGDELYRNDIPKTRKNINRVIENPLMMYMESKASDEESTLEEIIKAMKNDCLFPAPTCVADLVEDDEYIAEYVIGYNTYHCIVPIDYYTKRPSTDIGSCLEMTLHRLIDNGLEDMLYNAMGVEKVNPDEAKISIDLGYGIYDDIISFNIMEA